MYTPEHVRAIDPTGTARVIAEAPLACIVARPADGLVADPVPVLAAADGAPIGSRRPRQRHEPPDPCRSGGARDLPRRRRLRLPCYPSKAGHHRHVPTWNYQAVHVTGVIT
jgi:transcriptional regulator